MLKSIKHIRPSKNKMKTKKSYTAEIRQTSESGIIVHLSLCLIKFEICFSSWYKHGGGILFPEVATGFNIPACKRFFQKEKSI